MFEVRLHGFGDLSSLLLWNGDLMWKKGVTSLVTVSQLVKSALALAGLGMEEE